MTFAWMIAPAIACVVIAITLGWFGLHVLEREVIFVDLALAQVAALGTTYAVFLGHEPDEPVAYVLGLLFTVLAAGAFSLARRFRSRHRLPNPARRADRSASPASGRNR